MHRSASEKLQFVTGVLTALSAFTVAISQFSKDLRSFLQLAALSTPILLTIAGVLALTGIALLRSALATRSRLLDADALILRADDGQTLYGREDAIRSVIALTAAHPQLNIDGESGAGKTALLRAGVVPRLGPDSIYRPIYMDSWGGDWEHGPRLALVDAVLRTLTPEQRKQIAEPQKLNARDIVSKAVDIAGARLLLIFDQFDDYQVQHRDRFRSTPHGAWIPSRELVDANSFWRDVQSLVIDGTVHCIFITRDDAAQGLESVRFAEPAVLTIDRIGSEYVAELLRFLTSSQRRGHDVIKDSEAGWTRLQERLSEDLSASGSVLPAQMKLGLAGLRKLPYLTTGAYDAAGGLNGLEAADIEWHVNAAARAFGVTERTALRLLASLVDRETMKSAQRSCGEIATATDVEAAVAERILTSWTKVDLTRQRVDPVDGAAVWSLDHDYLTHAIVAAEQRSDRWPRLLRQQEEAFQKADDHLLRRWKALLPVGTQLRLLRERLAGRLTYGSHRGYAWWSLLRLTPAILVVCLLGFGISSVIDVRDAEIARKMFAQIDAAPGDPKDDEAEQYWQLATQPDGVATAFIAAGLESPGAALHLENRVAVAVHAAVGLDVRRRDRVIQHVLKPVLTGKVLPYEVLRAAIDVGDELECEEPWFQVRRAELLARKVAKGEHATLSNRDWTLALATPERERKEILRHFVPTGSLDAAQLQTACVQLTSETCREILTAALENGQSYEAVHGASSAMSLLRATVPSQRAKAVQQNVSQVVQRLFRDQRVSVVYPRIAEVLTACELSGLGEAVLNSNEQLAALRVVAFQPESTVELRESSYRLIPNTVSPAILTELLKDSSAWQPRWPTKIAAGISAADWAAATELVATRLPEIARQGSAAWLVADLLRILGPTRDQLSSVTLKLAEFGRRNDDRGFPPLVAALTLHRLGIPIPEDIAASARKEIVEEPVTMLSFVGSDVAEFRLTVAETATLLAKDEGMFGYDIHTTSFAATGNLDATMEREVSRRLLRIATMSDRPSAKDLVSALSHLKRQPDNPQAFAAAAAKLIALNAYMQDPDGPAAIAAILRRLKGTDRVAFLQQRLAQLPRSDPQSAALLLDVATELGVSVDIPTLLSVARHPLCGGHALRSVTRAMELSSRQHFDGGAWRMIEWARKQKLPIAGLPDQAALLRPRKPA